MVKRVIFWASFYSEEKECAVLSCSVMSDFATPWTVAHQAPLSMGILQARTLEWVAISYSKGSPDPGIEPRYPILQEDSLLFEPPAKPKILEWVAYPFSSVSSWHRNWTRSPALQADSLLVELQSLILCQTSKYVKFHQWSMFHFNPFVPKVPEDTKNIKIFSPNSTLLSYTSFHLLRFWFSTWIITKSHNVL